MYYLKGYLPGVDMTDLRRRLEALSSSTGRRSPNGVGEFALEDGLDVGMLKRAESKALTA